MGPLFHFYASFVGNAGGIVLTGITETAIFYGAETKNAQMAMINGGSKLPTHWVQNPFLPLGPGCVAHCFRNILALSGMRLLSDPLADVFARHAGSRSPLVTFSSDLVANCCAAGITMPLHMLYQHTAFTHEMWDRPRAERRANAFEFLSKQYFPGHHLLSFVIWLCEEDT